MMLGFFLDPFTWPFIDWVVLAETIIIYLQRKRT